MAKRHENTRTNSWFKFVRGVQTSMRYGDNPFSLECVMTMHISTDWSGHLQCKERKLSAALCLA
jgi:hypothetical protein